MIILNRPEFGVCVPHVTIPVRANVWTDIHPDKDLEKTKQRRTNIYKNSVAIYDQASIILKHTRSNISKEISSQSVMNEQFSIKRINLSKQTVKRRRTNFSLTKTTIDFTIIV